MMQGCDPQNQRSQPSVESDRRSTWTAPRSGGGLSGVMPGVAQVPVVMPVAEVVSVSRVVSSSANELSVR